MMSRRLTSRPTTRTNIDYAPRCRVVQRPVYDDWGRFAGYRAGRRRCR